MTGSLVRVPLADAPGPGEVRMLELGGHQIGLYQVAGEYYAVANRCPHRGAPLCSSGRVVRGIQLRQQTAVRGETPRLLRCPWHKWDFEIATGRCVVHPRLRIRRYRVQRERDELVITLRHPERSAPAPAPAGQAGSSSGGSALGPSG
ncbi:MAG TPA: Rieske (2Fe-2S) protein [Solirubrobacteraceae bacterium]|nr:Rieske (2Fe-2S) protein [Solirubrobacteraceae bacterium]